MRLLQISQFVILNRVKDLFLVRRKQILHSVQDDRIRETDFCKMLIFIDLTPKWVIIESRCTIGTHFTQGLQRSHF